MPGVPTTGSIIETFKHRYTDNDLDGTKDASYTVTITLKDDNGGEATQTFTVTVYNVNPFLLHRRSCRQRTSIGRGRRLPSLSSPMP